MIYRDLPPVGKLSLPKLEFAWTMASSPRFGMPINRSWLHRWGIPGGHGHLSGVVTEFEHVVNQASSHLVYAGEIGSDKGRCVQMVPLSRKSWTEAFFNRTGVSTESADAIWLGHDPEGFARLARINAYLLHHLELPPNWISGRLISVGKGFSRHADGGRLGGGHTACPVDNAHIALWLQFVARVKAEHAYGKFRKTRWAR